MQSVRVHASRSFSRCAIALGSCVLIGRVVPTAAGRVCVRACVDGIACSLRLVGLISREVADNGIRHAAALTNTRELGWRRWLCAAGGERRREGRRQIPRTAISMAARRPRERDIVINCFHRGRRSLWKTASRSTSFASWISGLPSPSPSPRPSPRPRSGPGRSQCPRTRPAPSESWQTLEACAQAGRGHACERVKGRGERPEEGEDKVRWPGTPCANANLGRRCLSFRRQSQARLPRPRVCPVQPPAASASPPCRGGRCTSGAPVVPAVFSPAPSLASTTVRTSVPGSPPLRPRRAAAPRHLR